MPVDYIPQRDSELVAYSQNYDTLITAAPTSYGLVAAQCTANHALTVDYVAKYNIAVHPSTRNKGTIINKDQARKALVSSIRDLTRIIQAYPGTTDQMRADLGITVPEGEITPINPPTMSPIIKIVSVYGHSIKLKLTTADSERRGLPDGVDGISIFSATGATPPADINQWKFEGNASKAAFTLELDSSIPAGSMVWLTAFFFSPRKQSGPASTPIATYIGGGVSIAA